MASQHAEELLAAAVPRGTDAFDVEIGEALCDLPHSLLLPCDTQVVELRIVVPAMRSDLVTGLADDVQRLLVSPGIESVRRDVPGSPEPEALGRLN